MPVPFGVAPGDRVPPLLTVTVPTVPLPPKVAVALTVTGTGEKPVEVLAAPLTSKVPALTVAALPVRKAVVFTAISPGPVLVRLVGVAAALRTLDAVSRPASTATGALALRTISKTVLFPSRLRRAPAPPIPVPLRTGPNEPGSVRPPLSSTAAPLATVTPPMLPRDPPALTKRSTPAFTWKP